MPLASSNSSVADSAGASPSVDTLTLVVHPPENEWHWPEYFAEAAGTAWNLAVGLCAIFFDFSDGWMSHHVPSVSLRLLITGLIYSGSGSLFAVSPLGKLSGAHINPSVTLAFWLRKKMSGHDAIGYILFQYLGAIVAAAIVIPLWGARATAVNDGMTFPGNNYNVPIAFAAEVFMTGLLVLTIFVFVSDKRTMRWTPIAVWLLVAAEVWQGAPISGTSLNPARSFGPALIAWRWRSQWIYLLSPLCGSVAAVLVFRFAAANRRLLSGKMFHSSLYRSIFRHSTAPIAELPIA